MPRRILCVTSNFPRWQGDSTTPFVLHLAQDLAARGWHVDVLAPHAPDAARREQLGGIDVRRFRYLWPARAQTVCYQGGALINLRRNPLNKLKLPALIAAETLAVASRLANGHYDLLHSHWILPQGFTGMLARTGRRLPHVLTVHGGDIFGLQGRVLGWFKRTALNAADAVTVNSSVTEAAVRALTPDLRNLRRIPMGVATNPPDAEQRALGAQLRARYRRDNGPLLLYIGRLVEEKGVADLLHATALLRAEQPHLTTLIVGEGQDRADLEALARQLGIQHNTHFTGWIDSDAIPAHYAAADAFIGPSRTAANGWIEAQGLTFLEAMAAGTPVIATRSGGIVDYLIDGDTGLLVAERAPEQIAAAVRRLIAEPDLGPALAARGRALVNQHYSRDASAEHFAQLFSTLLGDNG